MAKKNKPAKTDVAKESKPEKAAIVIKETEEDVVLGSGFTGDPDEFKEEIKKEAESGDMFKKFFLPLLVFVLIGGAVGFATWYYARPEKTVPKTEEKIQTPPKVEPKDTVAPAVTTPATPAPATVKKDKDYAIQEGDTLSSVANANGMTSQELATYNNITDVNTLHIGQVIKIPIK
jgi:LysM repeat protein